MGGSPRHAIPSNRVDIRLSFGASDKKVIPRRVIAHHLILTGYGHWLPNDSRGSGSTELKQEKLADLGPVHYGRKRVQPQRKELKEFYKNARERLEFESLWFDPAKRQALSEAFFSVIRNRYTVWACAICSNHAHFCIRAHRDSGDVMWSLLTDAGRKSIRQFSDVATEHPVWTRAPYDVLLFEPEEIRDRIEYINNNPVKEGLARQSWPFVQVYDGWPLHSRQ